MTAAETVAAVNATFGSGLRLIGRCPGGEVGAHEVVSADGDRLVLKCYERPGALSTLERVAVTVERLRALGHPAPEYRLVGTVPGAAVTLQCLLPGDPLDDLTPSAVARLVEVNALQTGQADTGGGWAAFVAETLLCGADGWCLHAPVRSWSGATASLLDRIEGVGRAMAGMELPDDDVVHLDFHHRNVLGRDGVVTGVIDWEGCRSGDRLFDLVTLAFCSREADTRPDACAWLTELAADAQPRVVEAYVAHLALRQVDWSIRHRTPADVERWRRWGDEALSLLR